MKKEDLITPCYIFNKPDFIRNLQAFKYYLDKYFPNRNILGYSFKTNSLPHLLNTVKEQNCYAEVVSETEYQLAEEIGFRPDNIIYNGPIKTRESFIKAIKNGSIVNIDSNREITWLKELNTDNTIYNVGLSVNFNVEALLPGETSMGEEGGRFGFCFENNVLHNAIVAIKELENINIAGLHMHISSKSKSTSIYNQLTAKACEIAKQESLNLRYIDLGGGYFGGGDDGKAYNEYISSVHNVLENHNMSDITLIVEPGASVVATSFDYLTRVIDVKETTLNHFVITDGSRLHIDPFFNRKKYVYHSNGTSSTLLPKQVICGYTCMENDRLMTIYDSPEFTVDNLIEYKTVGSYTLCFNSLFINSIPSVYAQSDNEYELLRDSWGVNESLQKCVR